MAELTPEERERIYLEEKERLEARKRLENSPQKRAKADERLLGRIMLALLGVVVAGVLSMVHVCWNVPSRAGVSIFVKEQPSYVDTFCNGNILFGIPRIVLLSQHPSLIHNLERERLITWEGDTAKQKTETPAAKIDDFQDEHSFTYLNEANEYQELSKKTALTTDEKDRLKDLGYKFLGQNPSLLESMDLETGRFKGQSFLLLYLNPLKAYVELNKKNGTPLSNWGFTKYQYQLQLEKAKASHK